MPHAAIFNGYPHSSCWLEFIEDSSIGNEVALVLADVLDASLNTSAANIIQKYQLAMADSIIYATVLQYDAVLWTTDKHFNGLPKVRYFDKTLA